jgi:hypothetical protein
MFALLRFFLALFSSLFKSKSRLEAENAALRRQLIVLQRKGARSRPLYEQRSPILDPALSLVSVGPQGHHDHPARDRRALASCRLSPVLALEIPIPWWSAADRGRSAGCVYRKLKLGHNDDAVRQGSRGNGYFQLVELGARKARPYRASDAFAIHYNRRHTRLESDAGALRPV